MIPSTYCLNTTYYLMGILDYKYLMQLLYVFDNVEIAWMTVSAIAILFFVVDFILYKIKKKSQKS